MPLEVHVYLSHVSPNDKDVPLQNQFKILEREEESLVDFAARPNLNMAIFTQSHPGHPQTSGGIN